MQIASSWLLVSLVVTLSLPACNAPPVTLQAPTATPTRVSPPPPKRQPLLRVAMLGDVTTTNVWALFDEQGASYANYAAQSAYWPRLYTLSPLTREVEPVAATGQAPVVVCPVVPCTAMVSLRPDLAWSDGTPLKAADVAFTANTVLRFQLSLAWREAYDPDLLERVETSNDGTVAFSFKKVPGVAEWQYGVLQGPIVNQAYWEPRIAKALARLPDDALLQSLHELQLQSQQMQAQVQSLGLSLNTMAPSSQAYQNTASQATRIQEDLNSVNQKLEKVSNEVDSKMTGARQTLFALGNAEEPTLGPWKFKDRIPGELENTAVLGTPLGDPWFDEVRFIGVEDELSAVEMLKANEIDIILSPSGLSPQAVRQVSALPDITLMRNSTGNARFLAFNHADPYLADIPLHRALACLIDLQELGAELDGEAAALPGFALGEEWAATSVAIPCHEDGHEARLQEAVRILKTAGYRWEQEPTTATQPVGLKAPDGRVLPPFTLLAPSGDYDSQRASAAVYVSQQAERLGIKVEVQLRDVDTVLYAVYGSGEYELALLGWQLSNYPAYLCDWFLPKENNPFSYDESRIKATCEAIDQTTDMAQTRSLFAELQSALLSDLPLIPLYGTVRYDAFRNVRYPFSELVNGLAGVYGAPALAIPIR